MTPYYEVDDTDTVYGLTTLGSSTSVATASSSTSVIFAGAVQTTVAASVLALLSVFAW